MKWLVARSSAVCLVGTFGILACIVLVSYVSLLAYKDTRRQVEHTQEVMRQIEVVLSTLKDAETGQRGYLLTGQDSYLEPFELAIAQYPQQLNQLTELTRDNLKQQQAIATLKALVAKKLAELKQTIALRKQEGYETPLRVVQTNQGKEIMDRIRTIIITMKSEESHLLLQRIQQSERAANQTTFIVISGIFFAALLSSSAVVSFYKARQQAEALLQQTNILLEQQVAERTTELRQANDRLQRELWARELAKIVLKQEADRQAALIATQFEIATAGLDLSQVMNLIVERSQQLTQADGAAIELAQGDEMVYRAASGLAAPYIGLRLKISSK